MELKFDYKTTELLDLLIRGLGLISLTLWIIVVIIRRIRFKKFMRSTDKILEAYEQTGKFISGDYDYKEPRISIFHLFFWFLSSLIITAQGSVFLTHWFLNFPVLLFGYLFFSSVNRRIKAGKNI